MSKPKERKRKAEREPNLWRSLGLGVTTTLFVMVVCLLVLSKIAYSSQDPTAMMLPMGLGGRLAAGLLCGFICGKYYGRNGATTGLLGGTALSLLFIVASFCLPSDGSGAEIWKWVALPATVVLSVLGGMMACRPKNRRRRRRT